MNTGHVTIKIETFDAEGKRSNIECFSVTTASFLIRSHEYMLNIHQAESRAKKEILTPTPKMDMA